MHRLETTTDFIVFVILSLAVGTLGALLLLFPRERLPEDPRSYRAVGGVLREVKDAAKAWVVGRTTLQFFVLRQGDASRRLVPAYGIKADSHPLKTLQQDIDFHNAGVNPWGGLLALTIGVLGIGVAALRWRQRRGG